MAKEKFSLTKLLNSKSQQAIETVGAEEGQADKTFKTMLISVYNLEPSNDNFYSVSDVDDIKDSIELVGIQQNLVVKEIVGSGRYRIITGHRRWMGSKRLVEEGKDRFEYVPCKVEYDIEDIKEKILLIITNSTIRELSEWEKVQQVVQLKDLLREYKKTHELPGRLRELLAETLNMSASQVARMESINDNLEPELQEEMRRGNLQFSAAAELSRMSVADQKAVYEQHKETGSTSLKDVQAAKQKNEQTSAPEPENRSGISPTFGGMMLLKQMYEIEIEKAKKTREKEIEQNEGLIETTAISEYLRLLEMQLKTLSFELKGNDLFAMGV